MKAVTSPIVHRIHKVIFVKRCLFRCLATRESHRSLSFSYRVGVATITKVIPEVCEAIWSHRNNAMNVPENPENWKSVSTSFWEKWQFPHCLGALDGKHVVLT